MLRNICIHGVIFVLCLGLALPGLAKSERLDPSELPTGIRLVVDGHKLPADSFSFLVQEVGAATPLLSVRPASPMSPASITKVVTTLAALETLGPNFSWKTELYALGPIRDGVLAGDLLIKGQGDPFLVEDQLRAMLKSLQRQGITRISGDLILDDSYFDPAVTMSEIIDNQAGRAYNTRPNALLTNFQTVTFHFRPHPDGRQVTIHTDPQLPNLEIDNRLSLVNRFCGGYQRGISFHVDADNPTRVIFEGRFPSTCRSYQMVREVMDVPAYTYGLFKHLWQELDGSIDGGYRVGAMDETGEPLLVWSSLPLADIIKSVNKYSNNVMTRHLLLTLGAETTEAPATVDKGVAAVLDYLESRDLDTGQLVIDNGSGLSRQTWITSALMNGVLQTAWFSPWMPEFVASLPLNGMDGTMRNRLGGQAMAGRMHIKTGMLDEVAAVTGYVLSANNRYFAVTGIVNHELADRGPGRELLDALLTWTYQQ